MGKAHLSVGETILTQWPMAKENDSMLSRYLVFSDPHWAKWERAERGNVGLPGKPLSVTQFPWLQRTSLSLPVEGQGLCEAMFGECSTGNHEYCWLEPLATEDKWGKEEKKTKTWTPSPTTSLWGCPQYKWDFLNQCGCGDSLSPLHSRSPPALNIPKRERRGRSSNNPNITNIHHPFLNRKTTRMRGHSSDTWRPVV